MQRDAVYIFACLVSDQHQNVSPELCSCCLDHDELDIISTLADSSNDKEELIDEDSRSTHNLNDPSETSANQDANISFTIQVPAHIPTPSPPFPLVVTCKRKQNGSINKYAPTLFVCFCIFSRFSLIQYLSLAQRYHMRTQPHHHKVVSCLLHHLKTCHIQSPRLST